MLRLLVGKLMILHPVENNLIKGFNRNWEKSKSPVVVAFVAITFIFSEKDNQSLFQSGSMMPLLKNEQMICHKNKTSAILPFWTISIWMPQTPSTFLSFNYFTVMHTSSSNRGLQLTGRSITSAEFIMIFRRILSLITLCNTFKVQCPVDHHLRLLHEEIPSESKTPKHLEGGFAPLSTAIPL